MELLYTLPNEKILRKLASDLPAYMYPNAIPNAMIWEGALTNDQCDAIISEMKDVEPYEFHGCDAVTREAERPLSSVFDPITMFLFEMNEEWWKFNIANDPAVWFQTYMDGNSYQGHTDSSLCQTRKLTAIALLSREYEYAGGELVLYADTEQHTVTKERGTMCVFPAWLPHAVLPVTSGLRQTVNLGVWGPPFK